MADPADFFKDQLPQRIWPTFPTVLKTAYAAASQLTMSDPILQVESAQDNRGRIVTWAVDHALKRAIENGSIPCDFRWREFAKPTGRYLELRFSHSTASVSQVEDPKRQPRNVVFRENARLQTPDLLSVLEDQPSPVIGAPHFILVHGYKSLEFAYFGLPSPHSAKKWEWQSNNLMRLPHEMPSEGPDPEDTDVEFEEVELLKQDIERWRRENGGE